MTDNERKEFLNLKEEIKKLGKTNRAINERYEKIKKENEKLKETFNSGFNRGGQDENNN